jgi:hypothetical protein
MINGFTITFNTFYRLHKADIKLTMAIYINKEHHPSASELYQTCTYTQAMQEVKQSTSNLCHSYTPTGKNTALQAEPLHQVHGPHLLTQLLCTDDIKAKLKPGVSIGLHSPSGETAPGTYWTPRQVWAHWRRREKFLSLPEIEIPSSFS